MCSAGDNPQQWAGVGRLRPVGEVRSGEFFGLGGPRAGYRKAARKGGLETAKPMVLSPRMANPAPSGYRLRRVLVTRWSLVKQHGGIGRTPAGAPTGC
jgi:hypothetical protein